MDRPKSRAALNANGRLGSYLPVSMALIVWRETSRRAARSAWVQSRSARSTLSRFLMTLGPAPASAQSAQLLVPAADAEGPVEQQPGADDHQVGALEAEQTIQRQ